MEWHPEKNGSLTLLGCDAWQRQKGAMAFFQQPGPRVAGRHMQTGQEVRQSDVFQESCISHHFLRIASSQSRC